MSRKHQEKYEKAKTKREMIIENLKKKSEDKILRAEEKRKRRLAKQKEKLQAVEARLAKVRCRKETIDQRFREKTVTKLVEDEERLRSLQQSELPLRAIFRREEILRYRQKLYEERQQCKERAVNKNQSSPWQGCHACCQNARAPSAEFLFNSQLFKIVSFCRKNSPFLF